MFCESRTISLLFSVVFNLHLIACVVIATIGIFTLFVSECLFTIILLLFTRQCDFQVYPTLLTINSLVSYLSNSYDLDVFRVKSSEIFGETPRVGAKKLYTQFVYYDKVVGFMRILHDTPCAKVSYVLHLGQGPTVAQRTEN